MFLKRLKWPAWVVIIALLTTITYGVVQLVDGSTDASDKKVEIKEWSKYPGLQLEIHTEEKKDYTSSISIPITEDKELNKSIQNWINNQEKQFLESVKGNAEILGDNFRGHLNIQVDVNQLSKQMYSLVFSNEQYTGGANAHQSYKIFNIDTANNKPVKLSEVLTLDNGNLESIQSLIKKEINSDEDLTSLIFDDFLDETLDNPTIWKWSMSDSHFTIYFDKYEIAAGAAGRVKVDIPLEELKPYLTSEVANNIENPQNENGDLDLPEKEVDLDPDKKYVALTFDDGPSPKATPQILEALKKHDAKATFFMLGSQVKHYHSLVKQVAKDGHEIGNHTQNHPDLINLDETNVNEEINETNRLIKEATGRIPTLIRPPYGSYNKTVTNTVKQSDSSLILWSVDSLDWKSLDAQSVNEVVQDNVTDGSIVLMHDIHPSTAEALPQLLTALEEEGYHFITVSQLLSVRDMDDSKPVFGVSK